MEEFINSFGRNNLIIVTAVIFAIILSLVLILLIEKIKLKKQETLEYYEEEKQEDQEENIIYAEEKTKESAIKTLEDITKKLVEQEENPNLIGKTSFEIEQEERSIISYDELLKASKNIDESNTMLLKDEGTEPITIEELYQKHLEESQSQTLDNPIFEDTTELKIDINEDKFPKKEIKEETKKEVKEESKKFKNSEIISPVFGIYNAKKSKQNEEYLEKTMDLEDLELEIKKTEEFLNELKELKNKLN